MSIGKEYLALECGIDYDEHTSDKNLDPRDCISSEVVKIVESVIDENKDSFYNAVCDIKSGHVDFPCELIISMLDFLFEEIKTKILDD